MNIKEEMIMNSGIEEETLDEGLVIFKESKKLRFNLSLMQKFDSQLL